MPPRSSRSLLKLPRRLSGGLLQLSLESLFATRRCDRRSTALPRGKTGERSTALLLPRQIRSPPRICRTWHLAQAAQGADEQLAAELEHRAPRAHERGGPGAAAAFLEKTALLTLNSARRCERALVGAAAKLEAGAPDAALRLLVTAELGPLDASRHGRLEQLRAQVAFASRRGDDASTLLLNTSHA